MPKAPKALGDLEHEIVQLIWKGGPMTAAAVRKRLPRPLKDPTVRTVLRRLEEKGYLTHTVEAGTFMYHAKESREQIAVKEANRLGLPVIGLIDTNCDPDEIDHPIPGNDDALKSIRYITTVIADAILEGRKEYLAAEAIRVKTTEAPGKNKSKKDVPGQAAVAGGKDEAVTTGEEIK